MTDQWLRVKDVPTSSFVLMQADVHRVLKGAAEKEPFATAVSGAGPQGPRMSTVEILGKRGTREFEDLRAARKLPPGTYELRFYVDAANLLQKDPARRFGPGELSGTLRIDAAGWPVESRKDLKNPMLETAAIEVEFPAKPGR